MYINMFNCDYTYLKIDIYPESNLQVGELYVLILPIDILCSLFIFTKAFQKIQ